MSKQLTKCGFRKSRLSVLDNFLNDDDEDDRPINRRKSVLQDFSEDEEDAMPNKKSRRLKKTKHIKIKKRDSDSNNSDEE